MLLARELADLVLHFRYLGSQVTLKQLGKLRLVFHDLLMIFLKPLQLRKHLLEFLSDLPIFIRETLVDR